MQAHSMPFSKVIDIDQGAREHFHVPKYQREYTWGRKEWEQLLLDIDENDPGYFMGSLICVHGGLEVIPQDELIYEVVDGQQRLTTLSILMMALHASLTHDLLTHTFADADEEEEVRNCLASLKSKLIKRKKEPRAGEPGGFVVGKSTYFLRVQPSAQNFNLADYRYLLGQTGLLEGQAKPAGFGWRKFWKAYSYFRDELPTGVSELCAVAQRISQLFFVQIIVGSQSDAFALFESLNNRGVPLAAVDIIKNKMLAEMERQHDVDLEESYARWQTLITALPEIAEQERFLRHYYNAFKHEDATRVEGVTRATKSQTIRIYETLIKRDASSTFKGLMERAALYGGLLRPEGVFGEAVATRLLDLGRVGAAPAYQVLLFLVALPAQQRDADDLLVRAADLLCRYHIRRNVTDTPPTRDLDAAAIEVVEACAKTIASGERLTFERLSALVLSGKGKPASAREFREALNGPLYEINSGMARYLLIQLDLMHHTREYKPDLWARDEKDRSVWTIEHVLPQSENLSPAWIKMVGGGDRATAAAVQAEVVDRLGNLTLSGYNSDLGTSSFGKKQELSRDRSFLGHTINIGYRNGLALNSLPMKISGRSISLATTPEWTAETIAARTGVMVDLLVEANKLPGD